HLPADQSTVVAAGSQRFPVWVKRQSTDGVGMAGEAQPKVGGSGRGIRRVVVVVKRYGLVFSPGDNNVTSFGPERQAARNPGRTKPLEQYEFLTRVAGPAHAPKLEGVVFLGAGT